ncbi:response regulator [bacterium]|nr:response regulator [bacterium]
MKKAVSAKLRDIRWSVCFTALLLFSQLAGAQDQTPSENAIPETTAVATILRDQDHNFVPDSLGQTVVVRGVLTSDPVPVASSFEMVNLQDSTGGILLFTRSRKLLEDKFKSGDEVWARGVVSQYQGTEQVTIEEIHLIKETKVPAPKVVTAAELNGEALSGQLVKITGRIRFVEHPQREGAQAELQDETGTVRLVIPNRFFTEPAFIEQMENLYSAEVVGIVSQKDTTPPLNGGYRLIPPQVADLKFFPAPPYRLIIITLSSTLLAIASLVLWSSRRRAIKLNREMRSLTNDLQQSQAKLRENQARLSLLTDQVPAIVWSVDKALRFTSSIGAGLKALNLTQDAVVGMTLFEYFKTDDVNQPAIAAHRMAIAGKSTTFQSNWSGRNYECHVVPLRNGAGELVGAVGLALDITERSKVEKALQEQATALRHSQKMEAVGRLAGGVAHDFNNLVTVIKGYCDLISLKLGKSNDLQDWFEEIKSSANRAAALTSQLLAFSRKQVLEPRVLDLNEVLSDMNRLLRRIIGEHIELEVDLTPELGNVKVDKGQFEQVIMNLAVNAYDAMPRGGRLSIKTENRVITGTESGPLTQLEPGSYALISFTDEGEGMSPEVLSRVFEPFFTTKEVGKGTGLGLATVYGIISQSGGLIDVESEVGRGTTFHIYLPIVGQSTDIMEVNLPAGRDTKGTETVLLAEDEEAVRALMRRTLEDKGYRVIEAGNGDDALHQNANYAGKIDLLVTDVVMPRMSGFKLAKRIRQSRPDIKTLYVSGYAYTGRHEGETISPETFLAKPFSPEMLALKVRRVLNEPNLTTP